MYVTFVFPFYNLTCKEYLSAAVEFVQNDTNILSVDSIKGIWVASNDPSALEEVRGMAGTYFPNVQNDTITMVSGGVPGGPGIHAVPTHTNKQVWQKYQVTDFVLLWSLFVRPRVTPSLSFEGRLTFGAIMEMRTVCLLACRQM